MEEILINKSEKIMKDEEKNVKKSSKRLIIAIAVIIVIAAIAFGLYSGIFSLPTGLAVGTQTTESQVTPQTTQTETLSSDQVARNLPYYESMSLTTGRHSLEFSSDTPVWVFIMDEKNFNSWKSSGTINFVDVGTGHTDANKVKSYADTFIVPEGEGVTHYILVEGAEKASISYKIT